MFRSGRAAAMAVLSSAAVLSGVLTLAPAASATTSASAGARVSASGTVASVGRSATATSAPAKAKPTAVTPFRGRSAAQIKALSLAAFRKVTGYRMVGRFTETGIGTIDADLHVSRDAAYGTLLVSGATVEVRRLGTDLFIGSPDGSWSQVRTGSTRYRGFVAVTYPQGAVMVDLSYPKVTTRKAGGKIAGLPTVTLVAPGRNGGTLSVAAVGPAYPLLLVLKNPKERIGFSEWNREFTVEAPPQDAVTVVD